MRLRTSLSLFLAFALLGLGCEPGAKDDGAASTAPTVIKFTFSPVKIMIGQVATITGTVDFADSDGNLASLGLRFVLPDGSATPDASVPVAGAAGQTSGQASFSLDVTPDVAGDYQFQVWAVDAAGQSSAVVSKKLMVHDFGNVANVCGAQAVTCEASEFCYNVDSSTCEYLDEHNINLEACADVPSANQAVCVSSLTDASAEFAAESQCEFVQWWSNPTDLRADCRCGTSAVDVLVCKNPDSVPIDVSYGEGPQIRAVSSGFNDTGNGPVIGREWFLPVIWNSGVSQDQTMIFAVNLDTGARRHVSGTHVDPALGTMEVGSGDAFLEIYHLVAGPDGLLYGVGAKELLQPMKIWSIDPTTGARKIVWDQETITDEQQCDNGNINPGGSTFLQLHNGSLAIDDAGNFYVAGVATGNPGPCIAKLDRKTGQCTYVTAIVKPSTLNSFEENIGTGYDQIQFPFRALDWHDGKLYAVSDTRFVEIDPATGQRKLISNAKVSGGLGSGPVAAEGLGDFWTRWDPHHNVFWSVGGGKALVIAIEPDSGNRHAMPCWHPGLGLQDALCNTTGRFVPGALERGGFTFDPDDARHLYFAHHNFAIVKYDKFTSNAVIFSL